MSQERMGPLPRNRTLTPEETDVEGREKGCGKETRPDISPLMSAVRTVWRDASPLASATWPAPSAKYDGGAA